MKWTKMALFCVCLPAVFVLWREGAYVRSPQYQLDRIVASGREQFELREVLGDAWKVVCFFPTTHEYNNLYADRSNDMLITWMKESLGRPITGEDWRYVSAGSGERIFHFLTDSGRLKGTLPVEWWQGFNPNKYYVACTQNAKQTAVIQRKKEGVHIDSAFERVWELKKL